VTTTFYHHPLGAPFPIGVTREVDGRRRVGGWWWPTVREWKGVFFNVPHYVVCPFAKSGIDDPRHAPEQVDHHDGYGPVVSVCICGAVPHRDDVQILPSH